MKSKEKKLIRELVEKNMPKDYIIEDIAFSKTKKISKGNYVVSVYIKHKNYERNRFRCGCWGIFDLNKNTCKLKWQGLRIL